MHPGCSILAEGGDIIIGDNNIIEVKLLFDLFEVFLGKSSYL